MTTLKKYLRLFKTKISRSSTIQVDGVEAVVVRKAIKNMYLAVLPPDGAVRVTAPNRLKDDAVRSLISKRLSWIKKRREKIAKQERHARRRYVSGESHHFLGGQYPLEVVDNDAAAHVGLKDDNKIFLRARPDSSFEKREELMMDWYKAELRVVVDELMTKWQKEIGVRAKHWSLRRMKTRWGTCNVRDARILLNLELAKKPISCIEYVVVHELVHLIEKGHDDKFKALMTKHLPNWKSLKKELNHSVPAY
jgi:hypothetical protein